MLPKAVKSFSLFLIDYITSRLPLREISFRPIFLRLAASENKTRPRPPMKLEMFLRLISEIRRFETAVNDIQHEQLLTKKRITIYIIVLFTNNLFTHIS